MIAALAASSPVASAPISSTLKAAQDFEALLIGNLLRSLEQAWSAVPGDSSDAGSADLRDLATQSLASALAASGGLGIARLIAARLPAAGAPAVHNPLEVQKLYSLK